MSFEIEDRVKKVGGSYNQHVYGTIKAVWLADDGTMRYSFRFDFPAGMIHVFSESNLELMNDDDEIRALKIEAFFEGLL